MLHRSLLPGRAFRFLYPAINFECLRLFSPMIERQVLVSQIRDTVVEPLDEETLAIHPYTRRGRFLATGIDLEKFEERSFYVESMVAVMEIRSPIPQRIQARFAEPAPVNDRIEDGNRCPRSHISGYRQSVRG